MSPINASSKLCQSGPARIENSASLRGLSAPTPPRLSRHQALDTLRFLNGEWDCYSAQGNAACGPRLATTVGRTFEDTWIQAKTTVRRGQTNGVFRSHMTFDEQSQKFAETNFVSSGDMGQSQALGWEGNELTFTGRRMRGACADHLVEYQKTFQKLSDNRFAAEARWRMPGQAWQLENRAVCDKVLDSPDAYRRRLDPDPLARVQGGLGLQSIPWSAIEDHFMGLRDQPLHICTSGTALGRELEALQRKCAPSALQQASLAKNSITRLDSADCLLAEPKHFPTKLLEGERSQHMAGMAPKLNTSVMVSLGEGTSQGFHVHGGHVFVQLWGEKKWSLFSQEQMASFLDPEAPTIGQPTPFLAPHEQRMASMVWDANACPDLPRPMEVITRPGDMLYLPDFTWHASWNLSDYAVGYTKGVDLDT